jgi:hypothetical protein
MKSQAIKRSHSGRSLCSVRLFQSVVGRKSLLPPFHSPLVSIASASPEKGQATTTLPRPHLHTLSSFVRRGYYIHNTASFFPLHSACQLRKLRSHTPFSSITSAVLCLSPLVFWRLLLRTAIGVGATHYNCFCLSTNIIVKTKPIPLQSNFRSQS